MNGDPREKACEIRTYLIGYASAVVLTGLAFAAVRWQSFAAQTTLAILFVLALMQTIVHFRFFLHIGLRRSSRDDIQLILFSTLIVALMVGGTLVILFNFRAKMM